MNKKQGKKKQDEEKEVEAIEGKDFISTARDQLGLRRPEEEKEEMTDEEQLEAGEKHIEKAEEKEQKEFAKMEEKLKDLGRKPREIPELELDDTLAEEMKESFGKWAKEGLPIDEVGAEIKIDPKKKKIFEACQDQYRKMFAGESPVSINEYDLESLKKVAIDSYGDKGKAWFKEQDELLQKAEKESDPAKKKTWKKLAVEAVDFIPVIGPGKILGEAFYGRKINDPENKLTKGQRLYMLAEGGVFMALDLSGCGIVATEGLRAGKLITRSAALMRTMKMPSYLSKNVFRVGRFLIKHPEAAKVVDKSFKYVIDSRSAKKLEKVVEIKDIFADKRLEEEEERMEV